MIHEGEIPALPAWYEGAQEAYDRAARDETVNLAELLDELDALPEPRRVARRDVFDPIFGR